MTVACTRVLAKAGYTDVDIHTLPGSLEIPLAARDLLAEDSAGHIDAVICFGVPQEVHVLLVPFLLLAQRFNVLQRLF